MMPKQHTNRWAEETGLRSRGWHHAAWLSGLLCALACLFLASVSSATVDGGSSSELLGVAGTDGRFAIMLEQGVQEDCGFAACTMYAIDTKKPEYRRLYVKQLPARADELKPTLCAGKSNQDCWNALSSALAREQQAGHQTALYARYLARQPAPVKQVLGALRAGSLTRLTPIQKAHADLPEPQTRLSFATGSGGLVSVSLEERWTFPSHRATSTGDHTCWPQHLPACKRAERWVDGKRTQDWVCPNAPAPSKQAGAPLLDCGGLASFVRVVASLDGKTFHGQSQLVAPGNLAQDKLNLETSRRVNLATLVFSAHTLQAYELEHAIIVVGAFAHGLYANGTFFPAVVVIPKARNGAQSLRGS